MSDWGLSMGRTRSLWPFQSVFGRWVVRIGRVIQDCKATVFTARHYVEVDSTRMREILRMLPVEYIPCRKYISFTSNEFNSHDMGSILVCIAEIDTLVAFGQPQLFIPT